MGTQGLTMADRRPKDYRVAEAAREFDISTRKLYHLIEQGYVRVYRLGPKTIRIPREEVGRIRTDGVFSEAGKKQAEPLRYIKPRSQSKAKATPPKPNPPASFGWPPPRG